MRIYKKYEMPSKRHGILILTETTNGQWMFDAQEMFRRKRIK